MLGIALPGNDSIGQEVIMDIVSILHSCGELEAGSLSRLSDANLRDTSVGVSGLSIRGECEGQKYASCNKQTWQGLGDDQAIL